MNFSGMNLRGLGTDIIEIQRIRNALKRHGARFMQHLFTDQEIEYAARFQDPAPHVAGRFAAKEAILKAFGTGLTKTISWHDIEIISDPAGKPEVQLSSKLVKLFDTPTFLLSISHAKEYAVATAIYAQKETL